MREYLLNDIANIVPICNFAVKFIKKIGFCGFALWNRNRTEENRKCTEQKAGFPLESGPGLGVARPADGVARCKNGENVAFDATTTKMKRCISPDPAEMTGSAKEKCSKWTLI